MGTPRKPLARAKDAAAPGTAPSTARVRVEPEAAFFERVKAQVKDRREGRRTTPVATVSFESMETLLAVFTPKRYELFEAVRQRGSFASIEALASEVHRDRSTVSRDLKALAGAGLLLLRESTSPGHGKRTEIAPVAAKLKLELVL